MLPRAGRKRFLQFGFVLSGFVQVRTRHFNYCASDATSMKQNEEYSSQIYLARKERREGKTIKTNN